jgi:hypothetical protein
MGFRICGAGLTSGWADCPCWASSAANDATLCSAAASSAVVPRTCAMSSCKAVSESVDRERQSLSQIATQTDFNSLISRVSGVSLVPLQSVISDLQQLHDFLHAEGEKLRQDMSQSLHLSQTAMGSAKI